MQGSVHRITRVATLALCGWAAAAAAVAAQEVRIAVGQPGRGYEARGIEIGKSLSAAGYEAWVDNYEGSDAISQALCAGRATVGIAQIDALYARAQEGCDLKPVGTYGTEYAMILFPPKSRLAKLSDLTAESRILVDTVGSGTELFWRTILGIETGAQGSKSSWASAQPIHDLTLLADTMAVAGEVDALLMVGVAGNPEMMTLIAKGWTLGDLYDKDIDDRQWRDASLYAREKVEVKVEGHWRPLRAEGYAIPSFIVVESGLAEADRKLYGDVAAAAQ